MGRRGPVAKSSSSTPAHKLVPVVELAGAPIAPPRPPRGLLATTKRRWAAFFAAAVAAALTEADLPAVHRLFSYYDLWERAARLDDVAKMARLERVIAPLEKELGLTPASRARLGIQIGTARKLTLGALRASLKEGS